LLKEKRSKNTSCAAKVSAAFGILLLVALELFAHAGASVLAAGSLLLQ